VGRRVGVDRCEKLITHKISIFVPSSPYEVAKPTEVSRSYYSMGVGDEAAEA